MKAWRPARPVDFCGYCGQRQAKGAPLLVITTLVRAEARRLYRCGGCAGEPVPAQMMAEPPIVRPEPTSPAGGASWRRFEQANLPRDWKLAQGHDDGD